MNVTIILKPSNNEKGESASFTLYNVKSTKDAMGRLKELIKKDEPELLIK